jgi:phosphate starvation-inducible protein PhoH
MNFNLIIFVMFLNQVKSYVYNYILTDIQTKYKKSLENTNLPIVICTDPSGTGKTMLACYEAVNCLKTKKVNKIIIT